MRVFLRLQDTSFHTCSCAPPNDAKVVRQKPCCEKRTPRGALYLNPRKAQIGGFLKMRPFDLGLCSWWFLIVAFIRFGRDASLKAHKLASDNYGSKRNQGGTSFPVPPCKAFRLFEIIYIKGPISVFSTQPNRRVFILNVEAVHFSRLVASRCEVRAVFLSQPERDWVVAVQLTANPLVLQGCNVFSCLLLTDSQKAGDFLHRNISKQPKRLILQEKENDLRFLIL